jgi:hypothetical protein
MPAAWRGGRTFGRGALSTLIVLVLLIVLFGAVFAAVLSGHRIELASTPYLEMLRDAFGR